MWTDALRGWAPLPSGTSSPGWRRVEGSEQFELPLVLADRLRPDAPLAQRVREVLGVAVEGEHARRTAAGHVLQQVGEPGVIGERQREVDSNLRRVSLLHGAAR